MNARIEGIKMPKTIKRRKVARKASLSRPVAIASGMVLGGFIPVGTYTICHIEIPKASGFLLACLVALVLGGLLFSAKTVWQWGNVAFADGWKATGFVVLLEGILVISQTKWLSLASLALLVAINGIATGVRLAK